MIPFVSLLLAAFPITSDFDASEASAAEPQAANVLRVYDLASVLPRFDKETKWSERLIVSSADPWNHLPEYTSSLLQQDGSPEVVVDILTQLIGDDLRFEGRRVGLEDQSHLAVLAPEEVHARVREALAFMRERLTARMEFSVDVLTLQGAQPSETLPGGLYDPVEAERLINGYVGRGATHRSFAVRVGAGRTASVDDLRVTTFVWDYDVEIAQGALVFDPIILQAERGARLLMRGVPVEGGAYLSVLYRDSDLVGEITEREVSLRGSIAKEDGGYRAVAGPDVVQDAAVLFRSAAFDTFLPDGQVLVMATESDLPGAQTSQVLVIRRNGGDLVSHTSRSFGAAPSMVLVNTELLSPPRFDIGASPWVDDDYNEWCPRLHPFLVATLTSEPSIFLFDWMKNRFSSWRRLGPWAIAVTSPDWDSASASELGELVNSIRHRTDVTTVELTLVSRSGRKPVRMSLPIRIGTSAAAACGISSHVILDYDVEVAQFASVGDPVRPPVMDGLAVGLRSSASSKGIDLELRILAHRRGQPPTSINLGDGYNLGELQQVDILGLSLEDRVAIQPGAPAIVLGDSAGQEGPVSFHVEAGIH